MKENRIKTVSLVLFVFIGAATVLWQILFSKTTSVYLICAVILLACALVFFLSYENSAPSARELALMAVLIALAVASRAVFYMLPQFKPVAAVVIVCAVCLGAEKGYIIGAFSAFVSNFIFGQGIWTPFQMVALGSVGFAAAVVFKIIKPNRWTLSAVGFVLAFALYGLIADAGSALIMATDNNIKTVLAVYAAGVPFSAVFGGATALFLFIFGEGFIKKLNRIIIKYGITKAVPNSQNSEVKNER